MCVVRDVEQKGTVPVPVSVLAMVSIAFLLNELSKKGANMRRTFRNFLQILSEIRPEIASR